MDEDVALFLGEGEDNLSERIDELSVDRGGFSVICARRMVALEEG